VVSTNLGARFPIANRCVPDDILFKNAHSADGDVSELGANTLRLYNVNPTTRLASEELLATGWNKIQVANGKDHRQFMDYAHEHGLKVIFPLVGDETALTNDPEELLDQKLRNLIDEVGNHPALLMWALGNELAFSETGKPELRDRVNKKMDFIREYTLTKWNRLIPVTTYASFTRTNLTSQLLSMWGVSQLCYRFT
jgi:hypothetical protein